MIASVRRIISVRRAVRRDGPEILPPLSSMDRPLARPSRAVLHAVLAAVIGVVVGAVGAAFNGRLSNAGASYAARLDLRQAPLTGASGERSAAIAELAAGELERFIVEPQAARMSGPAQPKLMIIFDDMGLDKLAFEEILSLPGPVTFSFLPYANDVQALVDRARARGDEVLLHLPMEPAGNADPGPHSLSADMKADKLFDELAWNLSRFNGYVGVNNHMGSKFTRDDQAMKRVLSMISQRGYFFVDSLTTGSSVALDAGAAVGAEVFARDVFLDAEPGKDAIRRQLALAEKIARSTGYAVVICHPRRETLETIGPWLTTAPARGFELASVSSLRTPPAAQLTASAAR